MAASNCSYGRKIPASNYLIRPENSAASNCRYGRKIPASNYQIRPENSASCNYRNGWKIQARKTANCTQGCTGSGRISASSSEGQRFAPTLCSNTFPLHCRKIPVAQKNQHKIQAHMLKTFFALRNESAAPGLGSGKSRKSL